MPGWFQKLFLVNGMLNASMLPGKALLSTCAESGCGAPGPPQSRFAASSLIAVSLFRCGGDWASIR